MADSLRIPGWDGHGAPKLYIKDSDREGIVQGLTLYRWDQPSVPQFVDYICRAAVRATHRHPPPTDGTIFTGSLDEAMAYLPADTRLALAHREPTTLERLAGMIDVMDERLRVRPLPLFHMQYSLWSADRVEQSKRKYGRRYATFLENNDIDLDLATAGLGSQWTAKAYLDDQLTLQSDAPLFGCMRLSFEGDIPTPGPCTMEQRQLATRLIAELSVVFGNSHQVAKLVDRSADSYRLLVPLVYHMARGGRGPPPPGWHWEPPDSPTSSN